MTTTTRRTLLLLLSSISGAAEADAPAPVPDVGSRIVVIDAGHGGSNLGAPGLRPEVLEKRVTLQVARALERRLRDEGFAVVMTRTRDEYLTLGERVRRANGAGAALFVSIHANASSDHGRRGIESYIASRDYVDVQATRAGLSGDPVEGVKARARARQMALDSARLANALELRLAEVRPGDRGVHQATYDVLDGLEMPAALVEIGFIDHPEEGEELTQASTVDAIASALAEGVLDVLLHRRQALARR